MSSLPQARLIVFIVSRHPIKYIYQYHFWKRNWGCNAFISVYEPLAHQPNAGKISGLVDFLHPPLIYWVVTVIYLFLYDTLQLLLGQSSLLSSHFRRQLWLHVQMFLTRCFLTGWSGFHPAGSPSSFPWVSSAFPGNEEVKTRCKREGSQRQIDRQTGREKERDER